MSFTKVDRTMVAKNQVVPMRDGIRLSADVYLPARGQGPWPVLLERTPYHKETQGLIHSAMYFTRHGYAFVLQDVRGRYDSEGDWYFARDEAEDGYDTLEWLVKQPWCNGKIGTVGLSYSNSTMSALATLRPPGLAGQFRCQGQSSYFRSAFRSEGGAMDGSSIPYTFRMAGCSREAAANPVLAQAISTQDLGLIMERGTIDPGKTVLSRFPSYEQALYDVLTHAEYDEYWASRGLSPEQYYDDVPDIPIMNVGGWYDLHTSATLRDFVELRRRLKSSVRLIMGPWAHGSEALRNFAGDADYGAFAHFDYNDERRCWLDRFLKGIGTEFDDEPPVKIFVMGGGTGLKRRDCLRPSNRLDHGGYWRWENEWPLARTEWMPLYLQPGGELSRRPPGDGGGSTTFLFDPANPVPTVGGSIANDPPLMTPGGWDQRDLCTNVPLNLRPDVLSFETEPLAKDVEVTGTVTVRLFVSSTAPETDFTAKLVDVYPANGDYPQGYSLNILDGMIRTRLRRGPEKAAEWMEQGEVYEMLVDLSATSNLFKQGHRIRVDISSSNFPKYDINPNTGEPPGKQRRRRPCDNTVYHSASHPSHILLPVIPPA